MSIGDLKAWILCDKCGAEDEVEFPFVYPRDMLGWSGKGGFYDHTKPRLPPGWVKDGDDCHLCEDCASAPSDTPTEGE